VLYADALSLRPLADEALWVYRGVRSVNGQPAPYSSYRQTVRTPAGFQERISSPLPQTSRIRSLTIDTSQVRVEEDWVLPTGVGKVRALELRSPVRLGDQINVAETQGLELTDDVDGDGKKDHVSFAAWSRVMGNEDLALPELERTVRALRVDMTVVWSVQRSSQARADAAVTAVESTWFAPGIGIVRTRRTQASGAGEGAIESDERLQLWDGISTGIGLLPSSPVSLTGTTAAIGPWLGMPLDVVRQGEQVFVLSDASSSSSSALVLSVLNSRGRLEHSAEHDGLATGLQPRPQLIPLGEAVAVVRREEGVLVYPNQLENLKLLRFDKRAQRIGKDVWLVDGALAGSLHAASDGQTVWVSWIDPGQHDTGQRLLLQGFDTQGEPTTRVQTLDAASSGRQLDQISMTASAHRVMVNWRVRTPEGFIWRQALGSIAGAPKVADLAASSLLHANRDTALKPLLTETLAALSWAVPLDNTHGVLAPRAVALNDAAQARRATSGGVDLELLALPAGSVQSADRMVTGVEAKRVLWAAAGSGRLRSETDAQDRLLAFATVEAGDAALSAALPQLKRLRDSSPASVWQGSVQALQHIVALEDRWMIVGHDGRNTTVAVLYKR
jgi:hypothetical protein